MSLLELGFELFEEILLLDNVSRVIPLARSESTRNGGAIGRNLLKLECSTAQGVTARLGGKLRGRHRQHIAEKIG